MSQYSTFEDLGAAYIKTRPHERHTQTPDELGRTLYQDHNADGRFTVLEAAGEGGSIDDMVVSDQANNIGPVDPNVPWEDQQQKKLQQTKDAANIGINKTLNSIAAGLAKAGQAISVPSPLDVAGAATEALTETVTSMASGDVTSDFTRGLVMQPSLGTSELIRTQLLGDKTPDTAAYNLGEFTGGVVMYAKIYNILKTPISQFLSTRMKSAKTTSILATTGATSGIIETGRTLVSKQDLDLALSHGGTAVLIDVSGDGLLRGGGKVLSKGIEKALGPKAGEMKKELIDWMAKYGAVVIPSVVRPLSNLMEYMTTRIMHSSANKENVTLARNSLIRAIEDFRKDFVYGLGNPENIHKLTLAEMGQSIAGTVVRNSKDLAKKRTNMYKEAAALGAGDVLIDVNQKAKVLIGDEVVQHDTLMGALDEAIGSIILKTKKTKTLSGPQKRLKAIRQEILDEIFPKGNITTTVFDPITSKNVIVLTSKPARQVDYNWWSEVPLAKVGSMIGETTDNPKLKMQLQRIYHVIQDHIDAQASHASPEFARVISLAREHHKAYLAFENHYLVEEVKRWDSVKKYEDIIMKGFFTSLANVTEAKKLLGPEGFNSLRQGWVVNLLEGVTKRTPDMLDQHFIDAKLLMDKLNTTPATDLDGDFIRDMFSDKGYAHLLTGEAYEVNTDAAKKFVDFKAFIDRIKDLSIAQRTLVRGSGQEQFGGGGFERQSWGAMAKQPISATRDLLSALLLMRKGGEKYLQPIETNVFLGASLPDWKGGVKIPFAGTIPAGYRMGLQSGIRETLRGEE